MEKGSRKSGFDFDADAAAHSSYIIQTKDRVDRNLSFGLETLTEYNSNRLNCNQILGSVARNGTSSTHKKGVPSGSEPTVTWVRFGAILGHRPSLPGSISRPDSRPPDSTTTAVLGLMRPPPAKFPCTATIRFRTS